jgi:hypothetical protein
MARQPPVGLGLLNVKASRSYSDTPHPVGLLWTRMISPSQRPLPDNTQHSKQTYIYGAGGIRNRNPSKRAAADPRLRPRGHWGRRHAVLLCLNNNVFRLRAGHRGIVVRFPRNARKLSFCPKVHTGCGAHPASYSTSTRGRGK